MSKYFFLFRIFAEFLCVSAHGQTIPVFVHESVGSLPKGRFMVSMLTLNASVDSFYGSDGKANTLSGALHQSVSFNKIAEQDVVRTQQLKGLFQANGAALTDSAGTMNGSITGVVNGKVPVLGYGITDSMGVYVSIPVLTFEIQSSYQFNQSSASQNLLAHLNSSDQASVAQEFSAAYQHSLETKLYQSGYAWDPRLNRTYLGDLQISFIQLLKRDSTRATHDLIQPLLILPTANDQDMHDLYGLRAGDRRLGLGLRYAIEHKINRWKLNSSIQGTYLFSKTDYRRIKMDQNDEVKELTDSNVELGGGEKLDTQAQIQYDFRNWIASNVGLHYQKKLRENWRGSQYSQEQYDLTSQDTDYSLLSTYVGLELNSIPSFLAGNFIMPGIAEIGIGLPISGKNAIAEPVVQLQGSIFF